MQQPSSPISSFLSCFPLLVDKTIKLWKVSEKAKKAVGYNLVDDEGVPRQPTIRSATDLVVPHYRSADLMVEATPRRIYANAHTYHINSISTSSDQETFLSADDLRVNLWHLEVTDQSFSILWKKRQMWWLYTKAGGSRGLGCEISVW